MQTRRTMDDIKEIINPNEIFNAKTSFYRVTPGGKKLCSQEGFEKEYYPSGHKINDPAYYPDIIKNRPQDNSTHGNSRDNIVIIPIERVSVPLQQIITTKHVTHVCGNTTKFTNATPVISNKDNEIMTKFKQAWLKRNMEVLKYRFVESLKRTGEAAVYMYLEDKKVKWRVFSNKDGDRLHPVYDQYQQLKYFGRSYTIKNNASGFTETFLEVFTKEFIYRYKENYNGDTNSINGWKLLEKVKHNYGKIPIVYAYNQDGPCWSDVQDLIDKFEMALSQLFENNKSYAFRIMFIKGAVEVIGNLRGEARALVGDENTDAKFLEKADASNSFQTQLENTFKFIQYGSFIVFPPEIKSGDTPSVAIKVVYSPAWEQAVKDINFLDPYFDEVIEMFKYYYGIEAGITSDLKKLDIRGELIPYTHTNEQEVISNINQSVTMGSLSVETASEIHPYSKNNEYERLLTQKHNELKGERTIDADL